MYFPDCRHAALKTGRAWPLTGAVIHIEEQRSSDRDRNRWIVKVICESRKIGAEERLESVPGGCQVAKCGTASGRQAGQLHRDVHFRQLSGPASHDEVKVVVVLAAGGV